MPSSKHFEVLAIQQHGSAICSRLPRPGTCKRMHRQSVIILASSHLSTISHYCNTRRPLTTSHPSCPPSPRLMVQGQPRRPHVTRGASVHKSQKLIRTQSVKIEHQYIIHFALRYKKPTIIITRIDLPQCSKRVIQKHQTEKTKSLTKSSHTKAAPPMHNKQLFFPAGECRDLSNPQQGAL